MNLNQYLLSQYKDNARGEVVNGITQYDCWGLVRDVRHYEYGLPYLPSHGLVNPHSKRELTKAYNHTVSLTRPCEPSEAAIACVMYKGLLLHVGVVVRADRGLSVLETTPEKGPTIRKLPAFEEEHNRMGMHTEYYT